MITCQRGKRMNSCVAARVSGWWEAKHKHTYCKNVPHYNSSLFLSDSSQAEPPLLPLLRQQPPPEVRDWPGEGGRRVGWAPHRQIPRHRVGQRDGEGQRAGQTQGESQHQLTVSKESVKGCKHQRHRVRSLHRGLRIEPWSHGVTDWFICDKHVFTLSLWFIGCRLMGTSQFHPFKIIVWTLSNITVLPLSHVWNRLKLCKLLNIPAAEKTTCRMILHLTHFHVCRDVYSVFLRAPGLSEKDRNRQYISAVG